MPASSPSAGIVFLLLTITKSVLVRLKCRIAGFLALIGNLSNHRAGKPLLDPLLPPLLKHRAFAASDLRSVRGLQDSGPHLENPTPPFSTAPRPTCQSRLTSAGLANTFGTTFSPRHFGPPRPSILALSYDSHIRRHAEDNLSHACGYIKNCTCPRTTASKVGRSTSNKAVEVPQSTRPFRASTQALLSRGPFTPRKRGPSKKT